MPAETHSRREAVELSTIVELLANILDLDDDDPAAATLDRLGVVDDLEVLDLWSAVAEEFGERTLGELDLPDPRPETLGELAAAFHDSLESES